MTLPEFVGSPATYLSNQMSLASHHRAESSALSWWWPLAPKVTRSVLIGGARVPVTLHRLPLQLVGSLHALIITLDAAIVMIVARVRGLPLRPNDAFALTAVAFLLRCALDTQTMPYYHAPLFLDLLAWDAFTAERLPLRALGGALLSWVLFERLTPGLIGVAPLSILYGVSAAIVLALLLRTFTTTSHPSRRGTVKQLSFSA